jgi:hypothetical protein
MPRYRIDRRVYTAGPTPADWVEGTIIDTGTSAPTAQAPQVVTVTGLTNGQEYEFRVVRLENGDPEKVSPERRARPTRFDIDFSDPYTGGVTLNWTDQRGGKYYRVDRWTTATDSPNSSDITSTAVTFAGDVSTTGQAQITGLVNGTTYRFRVHRLSGLGGSIARTSSVVQATPTSEFEAPPAGFTADGPASASGDLKAQFVTATSGTRGILVTLKVSAFDLIRITYVRSGQTATTTIQWTSASNFNTQNLGPTASNNAKQYYAIIPDSHYDITIPGTSPAVQGATVFIDSNGNTENFTVGPTYA